MIRFSYNSIPLTYFKRWTRHKASVFASLKKTIKISVLLFALSFIKTPAVVYSQLSDTLSITNSYDLDEVEVIAQAAPDVFSQLARTITVISAQDISSSAASTIQDLLEYVAGVDIRQRNTNGVQADIQLRGGTFDQVLVMLNGISISDPQTGHFNLNLPVSLSSVERIEILHGSAARVYGANAYKGVVNIITKRNENGISGGFAYGMNNLLTSNLSAGFSENNHYHNLGFSKSRSDGYTHNTEFFLSNLNYNGGLNLDLLELFWQGGISTKAYGANDFYSPMFPDQFEETGTGFASLGFKTTGKLKVDGHFWYRQHLDHFLLKRDDPSFYENFHRTDIYGMKLSTEFRSKIGITEARFEIKSENILSTVLGWDMDEEVLIKGTDSLFYTNKYQRNNLGFQLEQKYQADHFYISGGVLLNRNLDYKNSWEIFPGLDVSYKLASDRLKLFSSIGRSLRLPTFTDMFYSDPVNIGNPNLQPEELISFESGLEFNTRQLNTGLSYFRDFGKDVIDWVMYDSSNVYEANNIGEIQSSGVEVKLEYKVNSTAKNLAIKSIRIDYAYIDQQLEEGNYDSKYAGDFLKQKLVLSAKLELYSYFNLNYHITYAARNGEFQTYDEASGSRFNTAFQPYWLNDVSLNYNRTKYKLYLKASNLFDVKYNDVGSLVQPGRWILGGFEFNIDAFGIR